jgi:two-component system, response regulator YesN
MKNKNYMSFLVSYLFVALLPFLISLLSYNESLKVTKADAQQSNLASLERSRDIIDQRIQEMDKFLTQLSIVAKESSLSIAKSPYEDTTTIIKIMDFQTNLRPYLSINSFVTELYVFFKNPKVVISPRMSFLKYEQFYGEFFKYSNFAIEQWNDRILNTKNNKVFFPSSTVSIDGINKNMMMYVQSFPIDIGFKGNIIALIPEAEIKEIMDISYMKGNGYFSIADKQNNILVSSQSDFNLNLQDDIDFGNKASNNLVKTIDGNKMLISYTVSPYNGWKYVAAMPYAVVMHKLVYVKRMMIFFAMINVFLIIAGATLMAYQKSKPMKRVMSLFKEKFQITFNGKQDEIDMLDMSLTNLISNNKRMKENIEKQVPMLKNAFFQKLLNGNLGDKNETRWFMDQLNIDELKGEMVVMLVKIKADPLPALGRELDVLSAVKLFVNSKFLKHSNNMYYYDMDYSTGVFIIGSEKGTMNELEISLERIAADLYTSAHENYGVSLVFSVGGQVSDYTSISKSFDEAIEALNYKLVLKDKKIIWYHKISKNTQYYYYPLDSEMRLVSCVKECNLKMIDSIIERIYSENFSKRNISASMARCLISDMNYTLVKIIESLKHEDFYELEDIEGKLSQVDNYYDVEMIFSFFHDMYRQICETIKDFKNSNKTESTIEIIVRYVENNYTDQELNMAAVADKFNLSGSYLSRAFKEHTGETFSCFIERIRISEACKLLISSDNIEDTAKMVGYNSINAFRKTFKKMLGMTPSEYRSKSLETFL